MADCTARQSPMSLLDRFKPQPRWKHADPAVRAGAVADMPDTDESQGLVAELASTDPDVRVRRAAAERLYSVADLVRVARSEPWQSRRAVPSPPGAGSRPAAGTPNF